MIQPTILAQLSFHFSEHLLRLNFDALFKFHEAQTFSTQTYSWESIYISSILCLDLKIIVLFHCSWTCSDLSLYFPVGASTDRRELWEPRAFNIICSLHSAPECVCLKLQHLPTAARLHTESEMHLPLFLFRRQTYEASSYSSEPWLFLTAKVYWYSSCGLCIGGCWTSTGD